MAADSRNKLYLVDGTSQLFRAYFAIRDLSSADGMPTNAIYGFTTMLRKLLTEERPGHIAVAFDVRGKVFRHERYPEYKATRPPSPEDLNVQVPYVKQVCEILGVTVLERQGFEADDLIATFTAKGRAAGFEVVVVASDKDLLQLVGDGVTVLNPSKNLRLDPAGVVETFGVPPEHVRDVLGLMGDSVDNIPGVPGVGEKTAVSVILSYGGIEEVISRAGRFVALYDARDTLLASIEAVAKPEAAEEATPGLVEAVAALGTALDAFIEGESDPAARERAVALKASFASLDPDAALRGDKDAAKGFKSIKKDLKALDRGSAKRVWYAIAENADQARLSRELATLHANVPVDHGLDDLALRETNRSAAHALFDNLGFRTLLADYADEQAPSSAGTDSDSGRVRTETLLTTKDLQRVISACRQAGRFALGTTADGGDPMQSRLIGISLSSAAGCGCYLPLGHEYLGAPEQLPLVEVAALLGPLLADPSVPKVAHDLKTHSHLLRRAGMPIEGEVHDTMVTAFLLDPGRTSYPLDRLARDYLGREIAGHEDLVGSGSKRPEPCSMDVRNATLHAAGGAAAALGLSEKFASKLEENGLDELYATIDGPLLPVLVRMEARGIRVDTDLLARMSGEMEAALDNAREQIHRLAGEPVNVDSPKQLRELLFDKLGLKSRRKTAKGRVASTDAQTLEELGPQHPIAGKILEYRELAKLKGTYVDALPRLVHPETQRVHTCYHPTGAATGRLSSSDPNLQNIPTRTEAGRRIRAAFVPDDGFVFLASDYSQIELRVLAHLTGDEALVEAFGAGEDIHRYTASRVFGVAPDLVSDAMRRRAKAVNFGILYGMSETRLAREQGMKRTQAREFIQTYFERFGRVRGYIEEVRETVQQDGLVRTMFGRVRYFPQLGRKANRAIREQALRAAVNTTIQGTAADLMKLAMLRVDEALREVPGARILLQVHDELLLEVADTIVDDVADRVRRAMEEVHPLGVPLVVDQKWGDSWFAVS